MRFPKPFAFNENEYKDSRKVLLCSVREYKVLERVFLEDILRFLSRFANNRVDKRRI